MMVAVTKNEQAGIEGRNIAMDEILETPKFYFDYS
jgi:hypothetical protein